MILNQDVAPKQPGETRTYNANWHQELAPFGDAVILTSLWEVVSPLDGTLVLSNATGVDPNTERLTSFTAAQGTPGTYYVLRNIVTLSDGQVLIGYGLLRVESEATLLGL
jgi:hypothetical protein